MSSDDGCNISEGYFLASLGPSDKSFIHMAELGVVACLLAELDEQVWRRKQLKPRRQKVPAAQRSERQAHHDACAKWIVSKKGHFQLVGY